jgi:hypothetical protein
MLTRYAEFCEDSWRSAKELIPTIPNLVVLRTFSKWAGLAGLRVGYGAAHPKIAGWMMAIKQPYLSSFWSLHFIIFWVVSLPPLFQPIRFMKVLFVLVVIFLSYILLLSLYFIFDTHRYNVNAAADVAARAALEFIDKVNVTVNLIKYAF